MSTRIPAWRRLGLALQSEARSGVAVTESTASHGGETQPVATPDAEKETQKPSESSIEPAQNGKSSRLGKRKHHHEAAEESEPTTSKKSRTVAEDDHAREDAVVHAPIGTQEDHAMPDTTTNEPSLATPAKGDPNYRQGKKKKPKLTPKDRKKLAQQKEPAPSPAEAVPVRTRATLLASTEVDHLPAPSFSTPQKHQPILRDRSKDSSGSPPRTDRRKSVAFTPDTKRVDGDSGQTWFKKWAAEQKGEEPEAIEQPSFTSAPVTTEEPKEAAETERKEKKKKKKKDKKDKTSSKEKEAAAFAASTAAKEEQVAAQPASQPAKPSKDSKSQSAAAAKGKKKDPSVYISYLTQYYNDRDNWKFNKAKQNDVVDNALNIFRIPDQHSEALLEYIKGLKGAGVIERLKEKTLAIIKELDAEDAKAPADMDADAQKAAKEAALQERVTKERKRRKVEGDVESFATHPNGNAYIRRMRRSRAEALLSALGRTAPILPAPKPTTSINPMAQNLAPQQRARKSKRRTDISSDESSSDSSSDDSSSDDSDSESEAGNSSDSDSGSASGTSSSSDSNGSNGSNSDSDTKIQTHMSLSQLPAELIEQITSYLDLSSFRSFRLTTSHYRTQATHIFKHRFFITQHLQWTKASLQRLVDISAHPDVGNALHHLIIDATPKYSLELWKTRRRSADAGHMTPVTDDEDGSKLINRLNGEFEELQEEAEEVAKWFNETRFDVKCLTTVFSRLTNLESITFSYTGMESRFSKFSHRYCSTSQHEMSRPFISTLAALATSGVKVKHIKIHDENRHGAVSIGRLECLAPSLRYFDAALSNLEILQLNLRDWRSPDSGFELERTRAPFVVRFLAKCRNVRSLELSCYSALEEDLFGEMARHCELEKLERCRLDLFRIARAHNLLSFLAPSSTSLVTLELEHVLLADPEVSWADVFACLADSTTCLAGLKKLELNRLFTQRLSSPTTSLIIEGENWREECKDRGCRYMESEAARMWDAGAVLYPFVGLGSYV
ncbi:hypothetical protein BU25DRAFT_442338 [Macroventuria anomochaeta]|uniref:Uncharacterized protein n=1 Tax=Macroventuria anomochaeta TaxID=301207 RepID=A0ACB6RPI9_9PLEO|nr:uncharacterized protein BU25DRAFT_442338 [Macroventuria anomochaeta]KAF2623865.1 hypothetical protein BU25DRAFT_442338 [Macroventuria anomochaeta]